jgi:hypothetical protein
MGLKQKNCHDCQVAGFFVFKPISRITPRVEIYVWKGQRKIIEIVKQHRIYLITRMIRCCVLREIWLI